MDPFRRARILTKVAAPPQSSTSAGDNNWSNYGKWTPLIGKQTTDYNFGKPGWEIKMDQGGTGHPYSNMNFDQLKWFLRGQSNVPMSPNPNYGNAPVPSAAELPQSTGWSVGDKFLAQAQKNQERGVPFGLAFSSARTGGAAKPMPTGAMDCSGFACKALNIPKMSSDQIVSAIRGGKSNPYFEPVRRPEELRPGDVGTYPSYQVSKQEVVDMYRRKGKPNPEAAAADWTPTNPKYRSYGHVFPLGGIVPNTGMQFWIDNSTSGSGAQFRANDPHVFDRDVVWARPRQPNVQTGPGPDYADLNVRPIPLMSQEPPAQRVIAGGRRSAR